MSIPKINYPTLMVDVHSLGRKVKFRPFLVREEKILLIAKESNDPDEMKNSVRQIVQNCVCEDINIDELPLFDIEMIFLKIRATSVGQTVKLVFNCQNPVGVSPTGEDIPCNVDTDYVLDLTKVEFQIPEGHDRKIMLNDKVGVMLKYPTLASHLTQDTDDDEGDQSEYMALFNLVLDHVECVFDEDSVTKPSEMQPNDLVEFLESLTVEHMEQVKRFFGTSPKVVLKDTVACKQCGFVHEIVTGDMLGFFI